MRYAKKEPAKVNVHKKSGEYLASVYDTFDNIIDIKNYVRTSFRNRGIVSVFVTQDGGYYKTFNLKTNI